MNNLSLFIFIVLLIIFLCVILLTLVSLLKLGDERKTMIQNKAQAMTFTGVIGFMFLQFLKNMISQEYTGVNPLIFLVVFSLMYLSFLLFFRKKYGG